MAWSLRRKAYSVKIYFSFKSVISIGLFLISLTIDSSGELIMIRSPQQTNNGSTKIKVTCVTHDNDGALFWMGNPKNIDSVDDCALTWDSVNVPVCHYDSSTNSNITSIAWYRTYSTMDWNLHISSQNPLEPELKSQLPGKYYFRLKGWLGNLQESGSLVFFHQGSWDRVLKLRRCEKSLSDQSKNRNCTFYTVNSYKSKFVNPYEWHAATLEWNETTINGNNNRHYTSENHSSKSSSRVSVNLEDEDAAVFYGYRYLHSTASSAFLDFYVHSSSGEICLELLVKLCRGCYFECKISQNLAVYNVSEENVEHGQKLTWKMVKYNIIPRVKHSEGIKIQFTGRIKNSCSGCYWSFHSIRPCASITSKRKARRISAITNSPSNLSCQKVSKDESILVNSNTSIINSASTSLEKYLRNYEPICDFEGGASCKRTTICYSIQNSTRCTCTPGFHGKNCNTVNQTVHNLKATTLPTGVTELKWDSWIHVQNRKWFCLKIELLAKQRNNLLLPDPVWKLYPIEKNQNKYNGTVLLETAAEYEISIFISSDDATKCVVLATTTRYMLLKNIHTIRKKELPTNRDATSITLNLTSVVNKTNDATVRILVYGSTNCSNKITHLTNAKIEWEAFTYEGKDTMPQNLMIGDISDCGLLPDKAYKVGVLVSDPVRNESTLIVIDIQVVSDPKWFWIIVFLVLLCFLLAAYTLYRFLKQQPRQPIYEPQISCLDSGAYPDKLVAFENSVRKHAQDGLLEQQYTLLPKGLVRPCEYGRLPQNKYKNRYGNMIAYDETRVMLVKNPRDPYSDYINANYIQGYSKKNAYIATQAPLPETVVDFWKMVWQEEVRVICMLVDLVEGGKIVCEKYWPEVGRKVEYGNLVISNLAEHQFADYTCRTFVVSTHSGMEQRQVDHLQYRGWTDQEIPMFSHSFLEYLKKLRSIAPGPGPIVVHCYAGVGRTGCIILCDICLRQIIVEGTVDVRMQAETMYNARANMLHNYLQYTLAHLAPIQFRRTLPTTVPCRDLSPEKIEQLKNDLPVHISWLKSSAWMHEALRPLEPLKPTHPENVSKNRFPKFMPVGPYLVKLPRYPAYDVTSDYISAVSVDGVKMKKQYLASQLPMPSTLTDFWRLIVEENVELIVILQNPNPEDPTCCAVIPREKTLIPYPYMKVETKETLEFNEYFTTSMLSLTDTSEATTKTWNITAITCNDWRLDIVTNPPPPEALVKLWVASEKIKHTSAPTLILCYDGFTACGLYIAMSFVLQRMALEQECDVITAVLAVRRSRSEFVQFPCEFHYLYDAAMEYMELFKIYTN